MGVDDYRTELLHKNLGIADARRGVIQEIRQEDSNPRYRVPLVVIYQILYDIDANVADYPDKIHT
jgi:hypothetical protein